MASKHFSWSDYVEAITKLNKDAEIALQTSGSVGMDILNRYYSMMVYVMRDYPNHRDDALALGSFVKEWADAQRVYKDDEFDMMYWDVLKFEGSFWFDSFCMYMEKNRPVDEKFYEPRRAKLKQVVDALQRLEDAISNKDGSMKFLGISLPPRVGKSTICIFFLAFHAGRHKRSHNAMGGHSGELALGFYEEFISLVEDASTYTFREIFPKCVYQGKVVQYKNKDSMIVKITHNDRFGILTCRGIDGTWTGAIDVTDILYIDDLIRDRAHSLSPKRMNDTYQEMLNKMFDRMQNNAVCLMVGTLWSVLDPLSRFAEKYKNDKRYVFVNIPALDENDESNFEYELGKGFTTEYYHDMRDRLDNNEWMAKYMQQPYVREGLVFPLDELNYFYGILPDGDYRTIAVADCAFGGGDYLSMPIAREYENGDTYVFDWIYDNRAKEFTLPKVVGSVIGNGIRQLRCEGNAGGAMYGSYVADELGEKNYKCDVTDKKAPNRMSKMEKIMAYSGDIKRKFYFLAPNVQIDKMAQNDTSATQRYRRSADYQLAMEHLGMFAGVGKNVYDDAPDGLTQLAIFEENGLNVAKVTATVNPFR